MPNTSASGGFLTPTSPAPAGDLDLARLLNNLVAGISGLPGNMVRPRWQPEPPPIPAPNVDYAAIGVTSIEPERGGPVIIHKSDGQGHDELIEEDTLVVMTTFYGPNCERNARIFKSGLEINQNWETALSLGLDLKEIGEVVIVPEQVNMTWYRRADLEIRIKQKVVRHYDILNILSAAGLISGDGFGEEPITTEFDTENVA